jgi:hypothetical protein
MTEKAVDISPVRLRIPLTGGHVEYRPRAGGTRDGRTAMRSTSGSVRHLVNELLALAVDAHGGRRRWEEKSWFSATASITGAIWELKGKAGLLADVVLEGETRDQRLKITPFPWPGRYATWEPYRQTIETSEGLLVAQRRDRATSFTDLTRQSIWDDLQVACFAAEANWTYFVAPFIFTRPDFSVDETEPWREDGEVWRRLVITYPDSIVAHTRQQTYCFDQHGLIRRLDYTVDVLGGSPAVDYPSEYRAFDGIKVPTRRRVYTHDRDGTLGRDSPTVAVDIADAAFF